MATLGDIKANLLTNTNYNARYISKTLHEEFKIESRMHRNMETFDVNPYKVRKSGKYFVINRDYIYKEFVGDISDDENESGLDTDLDGKPIVAQINKQLDKDADAPPFASEAPF